MAESAPKTVSDQEIDVPEKWIQFVDDNISASMFMIVACALEAFDLIVYVAELPQSTRIQGIYPHGASYWTRTAEIQTEQADGSSLSFFLKVQIF